MKKPPFDKVLLDQLIALRQALRRIVRRSSIEHWRQVQYLARVDTEI
jgi:hypothetical protein